jgi:hypothetical protein
MPARTGCCNRETCTQYWATDGYETDLGKLTKTGDPENWSIEELPYRIELNDGTGTAPAASARKRITHQMRQGGRNVSISAKVQPIFVPGVFPAPGTFPSHTTGIFIANAFVLWIDWDDDTLYYAPTDDVGTISMDDAVAIMPYPSNPFDATIQANLYWNTNGKWNIEIYCPFAAPVGGQAADNPRVTLFDLEFAGIAATGAFAFGLTAGDNGGAWRNVTLRCGAGTCAECQNGLVLTWGKTAAATDGLVSDPTEFVYWGRCNWLNTSSGELDPSITQVYLGLDVFGDPIYRDLHTSGITFWLAPNYSSGGEDDYIYLIAEVGYDPIGPLSDDAVVIGVALWRISGADWCCYGPNTFELVPTAGDPTYGGFEYDLNTGDEGTLRAFYAQTFCDWSPTITVTPSGPAEGTPCVNYGLWEATEYPPDSGTLVWTGGHCMDGQETEEPVFQPSYEGQKAYTVCE